MSNKFYLFLFCFFLLSHLEMETSQTHIRTKSDTNFMKLNWAEKEVEQISEIIPSSEIYLFDNATEYEFKRTAHTSRIIHFATHTIINNKSPHNSKLVLKPDKYGVDDGYLNAYEISNLNINAELVVLSACNTGVGKLVKNEGIMSLSRGFKYAGCPSIIVALWSIDDKATSNIMNSFYSNLMNKNTIAGSLRAAKLDYISNAEPETAAPFYWSGMTLIGKNKYLENTDSQNLIQKSALYIIPLLIILLIFLYSLWKQNIVYKLK